MVDFGPFSIPHVEKMSKYEQTKTHLIVFFSSLQHAAAELCLMQWRRGLCSYCAMKTTVQLCLVSTFTIEPRIFFCLEQLIEHYPNFTRLGYGELRTSGFVQLRFEFSLPFPGFFPGGDSAEGRCKFGCA